MSLARAWPRMRSARLRRVASAPQARLPQGYGPGAECGVARLILVDTPRSRPASLSVCPQDAARENIEVAITAIEAAGPDELRGSCDVGEWRSFRLDPGSWRFCEGPWETWKRLQEL